MVDGQPRRWLLLSLLATAMLVGVSSAVAQNLDASERELVDIDSRAFRLRNQPLRTQKLKGPTYVEERLADGELFYRLKDYMRASVILTDIVESYPTHRAYPSALMLLGEALYNAGDIYGARTRFRQILEHSEQQAYQPFVQRALGRLIDIALRARDFRGVEAYFDKLNQIPPSKIEAATLYLKAKYLYNRVVEPDLSVSADDFKGSALIRNDAELNQAQAAFNAVPLKSSYRPHADYFMGVIFTLRGDYSNAVKAFEKATKPQSGANKAQAVRDLAFLSLGRIYYETVKLNSAARAYQSVPRTSQYFDTALYEVAWVYIRQGDGLRAERALEVLALAAPQSRYIPDAKLLRGNLLLRDGRFRESEKIFGDVIAAIHPVSKQLQAVIERHEDPRAYFHNLVQENLDALELHTFIPQKALLWAEPDDNMKRAFGVIEDFNESNQALKEMERLVERLHGALQAENRVNIFADLRLLREQSVLLHNRLHRVRVKVAGSYQRISSAQSEIVGIRSERARLEALLRHIPQSQEALDEREHVARNSYSALLRTLKELEVEISGIHARLAALRTIAKRPPKELIENESRRAAMATELQQQEQRVAEYERQITAFRSVIEQAKLRVGMDDARYQRDQDNRNAYRKLVQREGVLLAQSGAKVNPRVSQLLQRAEAIEQGLDRYDATVDVAAKERADDMLRKVGEEIGKLEEYHAQIAELGTEARGTVGDVAFASFRHLQKRFHDLVLRSDVGKIDLAWAIREEHRLQVEALTTDRAREIQSLDDDFREIMDEGESSAKEEEGVP